METTALGAAYLAGRQSGLYGDFDDFAALWRREARFEPQLDVAARDRLRAGWRTALDKV
jgi:glycerol kinase